MNISNENNQRGRAPKIRLGKVKARQPNYSQGDVPQDGQIIPTERDSNEKDTHKLIVEVAERLFRQIGFQKTSIADIARELRMSPANIYRYFSAKSEINEAVCIKLLGKIEAEAEKIVTSHGTAAQKIRDLFGTVEKTRRKLFMFDRKLHDLIEAAIIENSELMRRHTDRMVAILEQIIAVGMISKEFPAGNAALASRLVNTACIRFCHPRLVVEYKPEPEPTLDQIIAFCLASIGSNDNGRSLAGRALP